MTINAVKHSMGNIIVKLKEGQNRLRKCLLLYISQVSFPFLSCNFTKIRKSSDSISV